MTIKTNKTLTIIFIIYLILIIFVGCHHEPWFDEAQAWLIARDNSYIQMLDALSYEGHPLLWYYILRTLQLLGLDYSYLYLVSIFFAAFGVYLFLFKTDFPIFIKALTPFSYPLFYQHAIISRSYCLIFPSLMLYYIFYRKYKYSNPFIIIFTLILIASISLYTTAFSFILFLLYLYDLYKNKKFSAKIFLSIPILIFYYIFTYSYLQLSEKSVFERIFTTIPGEFFEEFLRIIKSFFFSLNEPTYFGAIFVLLTIASLFYFFFKNIKITTIMLLSVLGYFYYFLLAKLEPWHFDILFIYILFFLIFYYKERHKDVYKNKLFYIILSFILLVSCAHSIVASYKDITEDYDASKLMAKTIKRNRFYNKKIYAYNFKPYAIQPYFDKNIFINSEKSWWIWDGSWSDLFEEIEQYNPDVILFSTYPYNGNEVYKYLNQRKINYNTICRNANMYYKHYILEENGYCLAILNEE